MNVSLLKTKEQGSIEKALAGDYDFAVGDILTEAWECTDGNKMPFAIMTTIYMLIYMAAFGVVILLFGEDSPAARILMQLASLAMAPMVAGLVMSGLNMASGRPISVGMLFAYYDKLLPLAGLQVVMMVAIVLGFLLLVIPGLYLSIALSFAIPLMVEKNLSVVEAFETSRKAVTHHWFKVFGTLLAMGLVTIVSMLPLGIGLFWTMPMALAVNGIMYRRIFGISDHQDPGTQYA